MPTVRNPVRQRFFTLLGFCALNWAGMAFAVGYGWARADALGPSARYWLHGSAALCVLLLLGLVYLFLTLYRTFSPNPAPANSQAFETEHDPLNGLINRSGFNLHLDLALAHARREQRPLTLLHLHLDGSQASGNGGTHPLLDSLAEQWQDSVRDEEALALLGPDRCALLAYGEGEGIETLAKRLIDLARDVEPGVTLSIGLAQYSRHGEDRPTLVAAADRALQAAQASGTSGFCWA